MSRNSARTWAFSFTPDRLKNNFLNLKYLQVKIDTYHILTHGVTKVSKSLPIYSTNRIPYCGTGTTRFWVCFPITARTIAFTSNGLFSRVYMQSFICLASKLREKINIPHSYNGLHRGFHKVSHRSHIPDHRFWDMHIWV